MRQATGAVLAGLCLAGCATNSRQQSTRAPDWEDLNAPKTAFAPAPATPTAPVLPPVTPPLPAPAHNHQPPPAATAILPRSTETWVPLARWCQAHAFGPLTRVGNSQPPIYSIVTTNGALALHPGSPIASWNGLEVHLGFRPQLMAGQPYVHTLDLQKTVLPLLQGVSLWANSSPVAVLDPGHGGADAGTRSVMGGHYEKEYTLDWALRLRGLLAANGWRVILTRSGDTDCSLSNRVALAEQHKADVFVSLHFNSAGPDQNQAGLETYCLTPAGMPSNLTRGFADDVRQSFPNNAYDAQNLQLASQIHRALLQVNGRHDRGVRRARFTTVLRGQQRPAVLVEGGYLSNPREARLISDPGYRQKLAEAVANGLFKAFGQAPALALNRLRDEKVQSVDLNPALGDPQARLPDGAGQSTDARPDSVSDAGHFP